MRRFSWIHNCLFRNKNYQKKFGEKLKERFLNTYKFSNHHNKKFILLLQKGVYHYEQIKVLVKFNETSLSEKEDFDVHLNFEDITDADYVLAKRVCKDFEIKELGENHDLHIKSNTLLLSDVFENFWNMCLDIYELAPLKFLAAPVLAWQAALKKGQSKIRSSNWYRSVSNDRERYWRRNM